jgi:hypothetical protein
MAKCFKCETAIEGCFESKEEKFVWEVPHNAVAFEGGSNFGSSIYDSFTDGISVQVVICDECLKAAKGTDKLREIKKAHCGNCHGKGYTVFDHPSN